MYRYFIESIIYWLDNDKSSIKKLMTIFHVYQSVLYD